MRDFVPSQRKGFLESRHSLDRKTSKHVDRVR